MSIEFMAQFDNILWNYATWVFCCHRGREVKDENSDEWKRSRYEGLLRIKDRFKGQGNIELNSSASVKVAWHSTTHSKIQPIGKKTKRNFGDSIEVELAWEEDYEFRVRPKLSKEYELTIW